MAQRRWRAVALGAALALLLTACGGGDDGDAGTPAADGPVAAADDPADDEFEATPVLADLAIVDPAAEFRSDVAAEFGAATNGQPLRVGDEVRTDLTGFALVEYLDGSVTRLDVATRFTLTELDGTADAPVVHARLDIGRAWNNVTDAAADGEFVIETAVGTATVRGTIFLVECPVRLICTFAVVEGTVEVETLDGVVVELQADQQVSVDEQGVRGEVVDNGRGAPGTDAWVDRNHAYDDDGPDPGGDPEVGNRPLMRAIAPIGDVVAAGDVIPLAWINNGVNASDPGECDGAWHIHDASGDGIFVLGFGPFLEDGGECGFGLTLNLEEGRMTGPQVLVVPGGG